MFYFYYILLFLTYLFIFYILFLYIYIYILTTGVIWLVTLGGGGGGEVAKSTLGIRKFKLRRNKMWNIEKIHLNQCLMYRHPLPPTPAQKVHSLD